MLTKKIMRAALFGLFALHALPSRADWVKVAETGAMIAYIDEATIRKDRNLRWVWSLMDYRQRREDGLMSRRVLGEFDCTNGKFRILSMANHSQPMAKGPGKPVGNDPAILTDVVGSTPAEMIFEIVCAR